MMNKGYVKISIIGKNPRLFLKRFLINKIKYDKYKQVSHKQIILRISYDDYLVLKEKTSLYEINVLKYYGVIKYVTFIKNNFSFVVCFAISVLFLFLISNVCFQMQVVHNDSDIRKLVEDELKNYGIKRLSYIPKFSKRKEIIDKIIKDNKDKLEWLEIERLGSKLIVRVTERKVNPEEEVLENRHIIAKKSGIIKKIEASSGVIVKKINDYVNEGDIIVSGDIIKDETVKGQVASIGVVYAETWYTAHVEYPLYYEETKYLNEIKNNYIIRFFNKSFALKKNYTDSYLEKKKTLIKDKVFPFEISVEKQCKTEVIKQTLSKEEAIKKAEEVALKKVSSTLDKDEYVISKKTLNFNAGDSKIEVDVFFKVYENITYYQTTDHNLLNKEIKEE